MDKNEALKEFEATNAEKTADAIKDLERIEEEVVAEATASVEDFDAMKSEGQAAAAAETAFTFEQAEAQTGMVGGEVK